MPCQKCTAYSIVKRNNTGIFPIEQYKEASPQKNPYKSCKDFKLPAT